MTRALNPRERRIAALGLLAALLAAVAGLVVWPIAGLYAAYDEEITDLAFRLEQHRRIAEQGSRTRETLESYQRRQPTATFYLQQTNPSLALAELQQYVEKTIQRHKGKLLSSQGMIEETDEPFPRATLKINMRASVETLREILYALESGRPLAFIEDLSVTSYASRLGRRAPSTGDDLNVRFDVVAYRRTPAEGPGP